MSMYADRIRQLEEEGSKLRKEISGLIEEANSPLSDSSYGESYHNDSGGMRASVSRPSLHASSQPYPYANLLSSANGYASSTGCSVVSPDIESILAEQRRKAELQSEIARQLNGYLAGQRSVHPFALNGSTSNGSILMPQLLLETELRNSNERYAMMLNRVHEKHETERRSLQSLVDELKSKLNAIEQNRDELIETRRKERSQQDGIVARLQETLKTVTEASRAHEASLIETKRKLDEAQQTSVVHDAIVRELRRIIANLERQRAAVRAGKRDRRDASPDRSRCVIDDLENWSATSLLHFIDRSVVELVEELGAKEQTSNANRLALERDANEQRERLATLQSQLDAARVRDSELAQVNAHNAALADRIRQLERELEAAYERVSIESDKLAREAARAHDELIDQLESARARESTLNDRVVALERRDKTVDLDSLRFEREQIAAERRNLDVERGRLEADRKQLDEEREQLLADAKRSISEANDRARSYAVRAKDARGDVESVRGELSRAQALIVELQTRADSLRAEAETARQLAAASQSEMRARIDELEAGRRERDSLVSELKTRESELQNAQMRIEQAQIEIDYLRSLDSDARNSLKLVDVNAIDLPTRSRTELIELVTKLSREVVDVRAHSDALTEQLAVRERRLRVVETESARVIAESKNYQHSLETLRAAKQLVDHELERSQRDCQRLKEELELSISEHASREQNLNQKLRSVASRSADLETSLKFTRGILKRSQSVASGRAATPTDKLYLRQNDYRVLVDQLRSKNAVLGEEIRSFAKERKRLRSEVVRLEAALKAIKDRTEACRSRHMTAEDHIESLRTQLITSNSELQRATNRIEELETELRELEAANAKLKGKHESDMRHLARLASSSGNPLRAGSYSSLAGSRLVSDVADSDSAPRLNDLLFDLRSVVKSYEDTKAAPITPVMRHAGSFSSLRAAERDPEDEHRGRNSGKRVPLLKVLTDADSNLSANRNREKSPSKLRRRVRSATPRGRHVRVKVDCPACVDIAQHINLPSPDAVASSRS